MFWAVEVRKSAVFLRFKKRLVIANREVLALFGLVSRPSMSIQTYDNGSVADERLSSKAWFSILMCLRLHNVQFFTTAYAFALVDSQQKCWQ